MQAMVMPTVTVETGSRWIDCKQRYYQDCNLAQSKGLMWNGADWYLSQFWTELVVTEVTWTVILESCADVLGKSSTVKYAKVILEPSGENAKLKH